MTRHRPTHRSGLRSAGRRGSARRGFTLVEVLLVVGILALMAQIVVVNLGAMVPRTVLDGDARDIMGKLDFLRTEAMLQGKEMTLELDLDGDRYRIIMPPEERTMSDQNIDERGLEMGWTYFDERVDLTEHRIMLGPVARQKRVRIVFDERGFTNDQLFVLKLKDELLDELVWTIQIRGLQRRTELETSFDGNVAAFEVVDEAAF
jgi:type II secretion system protein H